MYWLALLKSIFFSRGTTRIKQYLTSDSDHVDFEKIVKAIEAGDQFCQQVLANMFDYIAKGVVNIAYMFNPEAIFLENWTAHCPQCSTDIVRRMMGHYGVSNWQLHTEILSSGCSIEESARSAALLPVNKLLQP